MQLKFIGRSAVGLLAISTSSLLFLRAQNVTQASEAGPPADAPIDFSRQIRPILSENCFACHGPDEKKRKAGLRLDLKAEAFKKLKSDSYAIVPGDGSKSELIRRITSADDEEKMPPPKSGKHLTADQIDLLRRWIARGAEYRDHWAYVKPERPTLPGVHFHAWPRNAIDYFILARLENEGLKPSPEASRQTLIRRASLDLIGLPPSIDEVEQFVRDNRVDAYEQLVERLLASPHYGERWARPWLDQARYADSNGYEADFRRSIWPYRDWVINAFNRDLPFDQFTIEQLAGDLLPNSTREQKIATGFHRNTMVNTEGGTDEEEFRVAAIVDRVNTTFSVWMGTTIGCAQCHSHKFDPFTQREYYQLFAFLNQTKDKGRSNEPELELPTADQTAAREAIHAKIQPLQALLSTQTPDLDRAQAMWEADIAAYQESIESSWSTLNLEELTASGGVKLEKLPDDSILATGPLPDTSTYEVAATTSLRAITAIRLEAIADDRLPQKSCGRSEDGDFVLTDFTAQASSAGDQTGVSPVSFETAYADFSMERYDVKNAIDDQPKTGWSIAAYDAANRVDHQAIFVLKQPIRFAQGGRLVFKLRQESDRSQHLLGRFRLSVSSAPEEAHRVWSTIPASVRQLLTSSPDERTDGQQKELANHYRSMDPGLNKIREQIAELHKQEPKAIPTTLVMEAAGADRATHILIRGSHLNQGDEVQPGTPSVLHPWPAGQPTNRLGFARWLVDPANPLIGRVTLNRIWAQYFGRGLIETSEDLGAQGELPTHPELLDWLAAEFIREGWSQKAMHRLIVTSATYRQSSDVTTELSERDPFNRLLGRGPRFRLEAEMLRDTALAVGGLLLEKIGGPSVFPYQPDGVWSSPYNGDRWVLSKDGDQFRRGIYTFWRRTAPYASFGAFDAPSREVACERRPRSNTPIQALVTLNDPAFLVAAKGLARRVIRQGGNSPEARLGYAFECCLARQPEPNELRPLLRLYAESLDRFGRDRKAAESIVGIGMSPPEGEAALAEAAAWTVISNVLLNLDETLTKG